MRATWLFLVIKSGLVLFSTAFEQSVFHSRQRNLGQLYPGEFDSELLARSACLSMGGLRRREVECRILWYGILWKSELLGIL
jgi:hypothetical protein